MLKNAYSLAILSTDTAETEQNVAEMLTKFRAVTGRASHSCMAQPADPEAAVREVPATERRADGLVVVNGKLNGKGKGLPIRVDYRIADLCLV